MRLVNIELDIDLKFQDNEVYVIVIENPKIITKVITTLHVQVNGGEGGFVLSKNDKLLPISKNVIFNMEPISISINDKKVITKLYQEISREIEEMYIEEKQILNTRLLEFLDIAISGLPYPVEYEINVDLIGILKLQNVRIEEENQSLLEKIINYIKIMSELCGYYIFIFVNMKMYLTEIELKYLYESALYSKVNLILIENVDRGMKENEVGYIIDKEGCVISLQ